MKHLMLALKVAAVVGGAAIFTAPVAQAFSDGAPAQAPDAAIWRVALTEGTPGDTDDEALAAALEMGAQHYVDYCAACHGDTGRGGVGPSLASNARLEDPVAVYRQIAEGGGEMPGFDSVLDEEGLLAVATYIRSNWGNDYGLVTREDVGLEDGDENSAAD